jgi:CBS domain-containing protein
MQAKDIMTSPVITVAPEAPVAEVAALLLEKHISAVPVVEPGGRLAGIVSEGDLMRRPESGTERRQSWWLALVSDPQSDAREFVKSHGLHAKDVMSRELVTVGEDAPLDRIADLLEKHGIKRVPVVRDGRVVGIVSRANLLQALIARPQASAVQADDRALRDAVKSALGATGARALYVNVLVTEGVVHLWGLAHTDEERQAMRVAAEGVPGVRQVEARINLLPRGLGRAG